MRNASPLIALCGAAAPSQTRTPANKILIALTYSIRPKAEPTYG